MATSRQTAMNIIWRGVWKLDQDIADAERQLSQLKAKRDELKLIRDAGLADLPKGQAAKLGAALITRSKQL